MKTVKLGSFKIGEDKIFVADPSYDYGDCGTVLLKKVLLGKYFANVTTADNLITSLKICHSDFKNCDLNFERCGVISVDSGQAGFFDKNYFIKKQGGEVGELNSLYGFSCAVTSSPKQAGIIHKKRRGVLQRFWRWSLPRFRREKFGEQNYFRLHCVYLNWRN